MKIDAKMKECFKPHVIMHSLVGLGIGIVLTALIPQLRMIWLGLAVIVIGVAWDMMRK